MKSVVHTDMVHFVLHASVKTTYTDASKTHYALPVYTNVFLKMNPRVRNM